jgi:NADPH-dependent 2,4-dienoyl-CoA reductase/sulfur reductase-like enzyme
MSQNVCGQTKKARTEGATTELTTMKQALPSLLVATVAAFTTTGVPSFTLTSQSSRTSTSLFAKKKYVVVGGGWGGWGAAKALCEGMEDADVTLIDALPDPTGVSS